MHFSRRAIPLGPVLWLLGCGEAARPTGSPETSPSSDRGTITAVAPAIGASAAGQWSAPCGWPSYTAIHAHLLPNRKVLFWSGKEGPSPGPPPTFVWDPAACASAAVPNARTDIFCSGHAFLPDGRLLVTGGHIEGAAGSNDANIFDYATNSWLGVADMNKGRWYPTTTTLPNGEVLTIGGSDENKQSNPLPQVWKIGGGWRALTTAQRDVWFYPWMYVAPNGKVFDAGPERTTLYLSTAGSGAWSTVARSNLAARHDGSSVMYAPGKVLIVGCGDPPTNTAEIINLSATSPAFRYTRSSGYARRHLIATILPNGRVLVTGGTSAGGTNNPAGAVLAAEMWDPATGQWSTMASMSIRRLYHSTALLLPDARVLTAGGDVNSTADQPNAEIYAPPYLFKADGTAAARPTISSAPTSVGYGQTFFVGTPNATSIARVTWVRLSSVTHGFNMNQRFNQLAFTGTTGGLNVKAPGGGRLAPRGHYMLFLLNSKGVPSVARIIRIG